MNKDDQLEDRINQALDSSVENLSPEIRRSLNRIRIEAVENKDSKNHLWKYASAFSIIFVFYFGFQLIEPVSQNSENLFAEVLQEDLEMLDDLEFVYWMAEAGTSETL